MKDFLKKVIGDLEGKKEWKAMEARVKALPEDYQTVYHEIKHYLWKSSGLGMIDPFKDLLERFEEGAANGKHVLELTGDDVAAFADKLVRGDKAYLYDYREKLNKAIAKKLKK